MSDKLKPCQCKASTDDEVVWDINRSSCCVCCEVCGMSTPYFPDYIDAYKVWNHRPIEDALRAELEESADTINRERKEHREQLAEAKTENDILADKLRIERDHNSTKNAEIERLAMQVKLVLDADIYTRRIAELEAELAEEKVEIVILEDNLAYEKGENSELEDELAEAQRATCVLGIKCVIMRYYDCHNEIVVMALHKHTSIPVYEIECWMEGNDDWCQDEPGELIDWLIERGVGL